jgi:hypothetical protein
MCLGPSAHKYHERAYFALEPKEISNDKKRLTVKFFWLPRNQYSPKVDILRTPLIPEDAVAKFEEREAKKRMVLSSGKC